MDPIGTPLDTSKYYITYKSDGTLRLIPKVSSTGMPPPYDHSYTTTTTTAPPTITSTTPSSVASAPTEDRTSHLISKMKKAMGPLVTYLDKPLGGQLSASSTTKLEESLRRCTEQLKSFADSCLLANVECGKLRSNNAGVTEILGEAMQLLGSQLHDLSVTIETATLPVKPTKSKAGDKSARMMREIQLKTFSETLISSYIVHLAQIACELSEVQDKLRNLQLVPRGVPSSVDPRTTSTRGPEPVGYYEEGRNSFNRSTDGDLRTVGEFARNSSKGYEGERRTSRDSEHHTATSRNGEHHTATSRDGDLHTPTSRDGDLHTPTSRDGDLHTPTSRDGDLHTPTSRDGDLHTPTSRDGDLHTPTSRDGDDEHFNATTHNIPSEHCQKGEKSI